MPKVKTPTEARCEVCFRLYPFSDLSETQGYATCPTCAEYVSGSTTQTKMSYDVQEPETPAPTGMPWFAVAVYGSDNKVRNNIRKRVQGHGLSGMMGRIVIPKTRETKTTKKSWEVIGEDDRVLGHVGGEDHEEALWNAKQKWEKVKTKGVYKPDPVQDDPFDRVEVQREKRRNVYVAVSKSGRVMGRIQARSPKRAVETATALYASDKPKRGAGPRAQVLLRQEVYDVRLVKSGGKTLTQNVRAMPGYLLVQCEVSDVLFHCINTTPGVGHMLPYTQPMTYDDIEDGDVPPLPTNLADHEIERLVSGVALQQQTADLKPGDRVKIVSGPYEGGESTIKRVTGDPTNPKITLTVKIFGRDCDATVTHAQVRKM
jgi:transcription antitermination factor NusG